MDATFLEVTFFAKELQITWIIYTPTIQWNNMIIVYDLVRTQQACQILKTKNTPSLVTEINCLLRPDRYIASSLDFAVIIATLKRY